MAFSPSFLPTQNYGTITSMTLTDSSTNIPGGITVALVTILKADLTYLTPTGSLTNYIVWPDITVPLIITNILDKDYVVSITVTYYQGSSILTTATLLTLFSAYTELFLRQLSQYQAVNPNLLSNNNFWYNKAKLRTIINDAAQSVTYLNDQTVGQYCVNDCKKMTDNPQIFY